MNNAHLQLASDASKMLILLGKGILTQAEASQLRSRLDDAVYRLVRLGQMKAVNSEKLGVEAFIKSMHAALVKEMALLSVDAIVTKRSATSRAPTMSFLKTMLANTTVDTGTVMGIFSRLNKMSLPSTPAFDGLNSGSSEAIKRGAILRIFGSVVRNDEWMSLMLLLNAQSPVQLNTILMSEYSSGQGRNERAAKVASLVSDTTPVGAAGVMGVLTISAGLTPKVAVQHAKVAPLFSALMVDPTNAMAVNKLLGEATRVEEVALADVEAFVQKRLDALVKGLTLQKKAHETEVVAKRAAAERKKEDEAVAALKGMGAHLSVLASNPALLARALEAAGLAPQKSDSAKAVKAPARKTVSATGRVNTRKKA